MKPFRLNTVERLRGREVDAKAQELHAAAMIRDRAIGERDRLVGQLASGSAVVGPGTWTGADLDLANNFRQVLRQSIVDQDEQIAGLDQTLTQTRAAWLAARGRLRAVQALRDRHRLEVRAEQLRLEQRELDEHAGISHSRDLSADSEAGTR